MSDSNTLGIVVVSGIPGSGKTTLARPLARELGVPLVSKDVIKEALFVSLGTGDLDWSQQLGRAAHRVMYAVAADAGSVVLESHFWRGVAEPELEALGQPLLQIYCHCPMDLAIARYMHRVDSSDRHPGHLPEHQTTEAIAQWTSVEPAPLDLDGPLIDVDTTEPVDVAALALRVVAFAATRER